MHVVYTDKKPKKKNAKVRPGEKSEDESNYVAPNRS